MKLSEYDDEDLIEELKHRGIIKTNISICAFPTKALLDELRRRGVQFHQYGLLTYVDAFRTDVI